MYSNFVSNYMQDFNSYGHSSLEFTSEPRNDTNLMKPKTNVQATTKSDFSSEISEKDIPSPSDNHTDSSESDEHEPEPQEPYDIKPPQTGTIFNKDTNGITDVIGEVVSGDISAVKAGEAVKDGTKTTTNYQCPYCYIIISHPKRFLIHYKWHSFGLTHEKRMNALKEIEQFRNDRRKDLANERLLKQEAKDESEANFPCKDCDKVFIKNSSLKRHRLRFHPKREPVTECRICLTPVKGNTELRIHMAIHKNRDPDILQKYQCPECPKRYKFPHSLVKHMDTHLEKTHPCPVCSKLFGSPQQLSRHMKLHEKIAKGANFHCAYCGKSYYDAFTLQIHERNHTQEKPFSCEICNTAFSTNSSLQRHLKVSHSASKPHVCEFCGRCFSTEITKNRHTLREHADPSLRPYACTICEGRYLKPKDLRNHMYKVHPDARTSALREND